MAILIIFFLIMSLFISQANDYLFAWGWCIIIVLIYRLYKKEKYSCNYIDILLLIGCVYDLMQVFTGESISLAFYGFVNSFTLLCFYYVCRLWINCQDKVNKLLLCATLFTSFFVLYDLPLHFETFNAISSSLEVLYVSDFKFIHTPVGLSHSDWSTFVFVALLLHSLCILKCDNKKYYFILLIGYLGSLFQCVNSFSRGVYVCLIIYVVAFVVIVLCLNMSKWCKVGYIVGLFFFILIFSSFYYDDVLKTISFVETTSQLRSLDGRFQSSYLGFEIIKKYPLFGVGPKCFSFASNFLQNSYLESTFCGNTYVQLVSEYGVLALILFGFLVLNLFRAIIRDKSKSFVSRWIWISVFSMILIKESTFPTLLDCMWEQTIFLILLVVVVSCYKQDVFFIYSKGLRLFGFFIVLFGAAICYGSVYFHHQEEICKKNVSSIGSNHYDDLMSNSGEDYIPICVNQAIGYWKQYKQNSEINYLEMAKQKITACLKKAQNDYILQYNLYVICREQKNVQQADSLFESLCKIYSNKAVVKWAMAERSNFADSEAIFGILKDNPKMLESSMFVEAKYKHPYLDSLIRMQISAYEVDINNPIECAKCGKLLLYAEDYEEAKKCLLRALYLLPNLVEPRYYLSKIENELGNNASSEKYWNQYMFLTKNVEHNYGTSIDNFYCNNFSNWYGGSAFMQDIIFY